MITSLASGLVAAATLAAAAAAPTAPELPDADPIGFHARADKGRVKLGEPFGYTIEIRHRPEESYLLAEGRSLAPFHAEGARCRREVKADEARTTCTMRLALLDLGEVDVPDVHFAVERPAGKARLAVPGPRITAVGMLDPAAPAEALQLRDVAPPAPLLVPTLRPLWWTLGVLGALALLLLVAWRWWRRPAGRAALPAPSPQARFEQRLRALEAEQLAQRGRGEEHVSRLSEAVREYLAALTGLPALDLTSSELVDALARAADPRIDAAGLEVFLARADGVKFARRPADPELCADGLEYARALLARSRPPPPAGAAA